MIISKTKVSTIFSVSVFLTLTYSILLFTLFQIFSNPNPAIYLYVIVAIISPIALFVTYKFFEGIKTLRISKGKAEISSPILRTNRSYNLNNMISWQETIIKTTRGLFKEIHFKFENKKDIKISNQEQTNYDKVYIYLLKNYKNKKV
jgi:hypothetical protein